MKNKRKLNSRKSIVTGTGLLMVLVIFIMMLLGSCGSGKTYIPKPRGYFNIDVPKPEYVKYDTNACDFSFEMSKYAVMIPVNSDQKNHPCWFNILYPQFDATVHISYEPIRNDLKTYLDDAHNLVYKHVVKSSGIMESPVIDTANHVYGMIYKLEGEPASPYQFYLTDSTHHFFRASLYFNFKPNYDSLAQVVTFLEADMDHIVETFEWKKK